LTFKPKINEYPELIVEQFYIKFGDLNCIGFWDIVRKTDRHRQTEVKTLQPQLLSAWVKNAYHLQTADSYWQNV